MRGAKDVEAAAEQLRKALELDPKSYVTATEMARAELYLAHFEISVNS